MTETPPIHAELWNTIPPAAQVAVASVISQLQATLVARDELITSLHARIAELEARLNQNSTNSSKPPSSDPPYRKPAPPRKPSGKRKGGQPGHPKRSRPYLPPDEIVELKPDSCRGCGVSLSGVDPQPLIHQVFELPPIRPHVTEYRQHRLHCPNCQQNNCPSLPAEARSGYGPRLQATCALLSGGYRIGKRGIARLCGELLNVPISAAAVCKLQHQTTDAMAPIAEEAQKYVVGRPANVDETTWVEGRKSSYLWVAATQQVTAFLIRPSRARAVLKELIPGPLGLLTTDRYSVYSHLLDQQLCWAHLRRDFQALIDRKDEGTPIGEGLLACADQMLKQWRQVREGTLTREAFRAGPLVEAQTAYNALVSRWSECKVKRVRSVLYELSQLGKALWRFAEVEGVEPTNNAAERALRHGVFWRKLSNGTDTSKGSRFVERILTVVESCRQQGRNLLSFLTDTVRAARTGSARPSLIPVIS